MRLLGWCLLTAVLALCPLPAAASWECADPDNCTVTCDGTNDHTDIESAIAGASLASAITVGAGTCNIASTVGLNRAVTLTGLSRAQTTFTGSADPTVAISGTGSDFVRLSSIFFSLSGSEDKAVLIDASAGAVLSVRVDNSRFESSYHGVYATGRVEGVIDNNEFHNCDRCLYIDGGRSDQHLAWDRGFDPYNGGSGSGNFTAGSSQALFSEDNLFTADNDCPHVCNQQVHYIQTGARSVFRHNVVDYTGQTNVTRTAHDSHGNQKYNNESGPGFRGQPIHEIYENTYRVVNVYPNGETFDLRSGSNLVWNNDITIEETTTERGVIEFWEEEQEDGPNRHFSDVGFDRVWPTEDMVTNSFVWGNTIDGAPLDGSNIDGNSDIWCCDCCLPFDDAGDVINENRDVWFHPPQATGGRTYYNDRPGASGRDADGTLVFLQSGPNAYFPYVPYAYPHPLRSQQPDVIRLQAEPGDSLIWDYPQTVMRFEVDIDGITFDAGLISDDSGPDAYSWLMDMSTGLHTALIRPCRTVVCDGPDSDVFEIEMAPLPLAPVDISTVRVGEP